MFMELKNKMWPRLNGRHYSEVATGVNAVWRCLQRWEQDTRSSVVSVGNKPQDLLTRLWVSPPICNGRKATFQLQVSENKDRIASLPKLNPGAARTWSQTERWLQRVRQSGGGQVAGGGHVCIPRWGEPPSKVLKPPRLALGETQDPCILGWPRRWCPSVFTRQGDLGRGEEGLTSLFTENTDMQGGELRGAGGQERNPT